MIGELFLFERLLSAGSENKKDFNSIILIDEVKELVERKCHLFGNELLSDLFSLKKLVCA